MYNHKTYDKEKAELNVMYAQEQLQVAVASLMNKGDKYKFLNLAINTLVQDVKEFFVAHKNEIEKGADIQDAIDSLNDGILGEVQYDCTVACECIKTIESCVKEDGLDYDFDVNFDLGQFHAENDMAKIMPIGYESRLTDEEIERKETYWETLHTGLRFVDVRMPRTKYFNLFGKLEEAQKLMAYSHKGKSFDLNNPSDEELTF